MQEGQAEATTGRQGLSQTKRASHFDALTDEEIERIETIVAEHMARRSFATSG